MVEHEASPVRTVVWSEYFPWLSLLRTFRLAIGFRVLVLSAAALVLTFVSWWVAAQIFDQPVGSATPHRVAGSLGGLIPEPHGLPVSLPGVARNDALTQVGPLGFVWQRMTEPLLRLFQPGLTTGRVAYLALLALLGLAIWAFFGGAITRIVAVQLACEERLSWGAVLDHACRKWLAYFSAPLFPLMGIVMSALPVIVLSLLMRADVGVLLAALIWWFFLIMGLLMTLLLLGLVFGWPLMWATISSEGTDSFDALSRSFAYVFQRPLHYLFYAVVATIVGALGWLLVWYFSATVIGLTYWAAAWGAGTTTVDAIRNGTLESGTIAAWGGGLIHFWTGVVKLLALSYLLSFFWTSATAIYFLLRREVDATEMDEVYLEEEEQSYGLPPLATDAAGAPTVVEPGTPATPGIKPDEE